PVVDRYLAVLEESLAAAWGLASPLYIMWSNGGVMTADQARRRPIATLLSGPVGGAVGAARVARANGFRDAICIDMGGTSLDVTLMLDGQLEMAGQEVVGDQPLLGAMIRIDSIGAGGGSLAWTEAG